MKIPPKRIRITALLIIMILLSTFFVATRYPSIGMFFLMGKPLASNEIIDRETASLPEVFESDSSCMVATVCGSFMGIDCGSMADGPYYYYNHRQKKIVGYGGGFCMSGDCSGPPLAWKLNQKAGCRW